MTSPFARLLALPRCWRSPATPPRAATPSWPEDRQTARDGVDQPAGPDAAKALTTVQPGKLTACTDTPRPPFELRDKGQFDGIDIELVRSDDTYPTILRRFLGDTAGQI